MKIAFSTMGDERWVAGEVIVRNLLLTIRELGLPDVTLTMLAHESANRELIQTRYSADEYLYYPKPRRFTAEWVATRISARVLHADRVLERFMQRHGIDVFFGSCLEYPYHRAATLSWIPDFQHKHLPALFSAEERQHRDRAFAHTAQVSSRVILLSHAVAADFTAQFPRQASKARVLSPITRVPPRVYDADPAAAASRYHLPERFFYVPNQFWAHKNHERLFEAVRDLRDRGTSVNVVCTGYPVDYRNPTHFAGLWEKIARWGIGSRVTYLGLIPHDDVLALVRQSICVVNPSTFEGWGIGIDEARSVGKRILASSVPAHREQAPPATIYFDPQSTADLAAKLSQIWVEATPGPDAELEAAARAALPGRLREYGRNFVEVAREACRDRN
jgi:glycosyltransferase involved in cell wall biosynthesis